MLANAKPITVSSLNQANILDEIIRSGTGQKSKDYKPIVSMMKVLDDAFTKEDYKKANAVIKTKLRDVTNTLSANAKAEWGMGFSRCKWDDDTSHSK